MTRPESTALRESVLTRYTALASCSCSLSCGDALEHAAPQPGETVVDLGCGRGQDVIRAAGLVGRAGRAIGIDQNPEMLARARAQAPPFLDNVSFLDGDLASFPVLDRSCDVVVSNCTVNHAPDKEAVYREIHRVLRPGGRFVVADVVARDALPEEVRADPAAWAACYGGAIPEADNLAAMRAAGFTDASVLRRSEPYEKGGVIVLSVTFTARRNPW